MPKAVTVITVLALLSGGALRAGADVQQAAVDDLSKLVGRVRVVCGVVTGIRKVKRVTYLDLPPSGAHSVSAAIELTSMDGFDAVVRQRAPGLRICAEGRVTKDAAGFIIKLENEQKLRSAVLPTPRPAGLFADAVDLTTGKPPADVVLPRERRFIEPRYTSAAMRARVVGQVDVECVVLADGRSGTCRVARSLDALYGLDDQALNALQHWTFEPARRDGEPIATVVKLEVVFKLH